MVLNYIWVAFFVIAFIVALIKLLFMGNTEIFTELVNSTFTSSKTAFEISLGLTGILSLWLGIMKIGEQSGMINALSRWLSPVFCRLFPEIPKGHPAMGSIFMNLSANMLGLDNAATPMGLKAMKELQELNPQKDTATNPMVMFLVLNTSGLILIPISIMMYRAQMGAAQPTDIFIPILITSAVSTLVGVIAVSIAQRINLINKPILILIGCISLFFAGLIYLFMQLGREEIGTYSTLIANVILFSIILLFIIWGLWKKINVYDAFVEGAKEGFTTAVRIIPYLVAFLVGIAVFRTSGAMDMLVSGIGYIVGLFGADTSFVGALPTALMKSLSGSGANGLMIAADKKKLDGFQEASKYALKADIAGVYHYKGSVANEAALPTTNISVGDVYSIEAKSSYGPTGTNVAWTADNAWDNLGGNFSIDYATAAEVLAILNA